MSPATEHARVQLSSIRRRTGEHMVRSLATSPHAWITYEVEYDAVAGARATHQASWRSTHGWSLTYLPFLCFATCQALEKHPEVNSRLVGHELVLHDHVNLGIAVDLGARGLVVPVIRHAEQLSVPELARAVSRLADLARERRLAADDLVDGTYTISNPGPMGTLSSSPIINQPQVAILAVDGIRRQPVVQRHSDGTESVGIGTRGLVTQAFDHRAFDGATCAAYLRDLAGIVRTTPWSEHLS